jgi:hypothetical protein
VFFFVGGGGGGGGSAPPPPSCSAQYYCSGGNLYYRSSNCSTSLIQICENGCGGSPAACIPNPPTCSVTIDDTTIPFGSSTTLRWTSSGADTMYISQVGYVSAEGSTRITSGGTYVGTAANAGGETQCTGNAGSDEPAVLEVTPPPDPDAELVSSSGEVARIGETSSITATFSIGTGDAFTHTNIDMPLGNGLFEASPPSASRAYAFTPTSAGQYTFYARARTNYFTEWATYASLAVTVPPLPACTITISPSIIAQGQSATLSWSSTDATSGTITNVGSVGPSGSTVVSPSQATTYAGSFTGLGGTVACTAGGSSGGNPDGSVTLRVTCAPHYSCLNNNVVYVDSACEITTHAVCSAPTYCTPGITFCQIPAPQFNTQGILSGHLQARPQVVPKNGRSRIHWDISHVEVCTVRGSNGDSWTGEASGPSGLPTAPIVEKTTFRLFCEALNGTTIDETIDVNLIPTFQET